MVGGPAAAGAVTRCGWGRRWASSRAGARASPAPRRRRILWQRLTSNADASAAEIALTLAHLLVHCCPTVFTALGRNDVLLAVVAEKCALWI